MEKPFDLKVEETKESLIELLNNSGLPISVLNMMIKELGVAIATQLKIEIDKHKEQSKA